MSHKHTRFLQEEFGLSRWTVRFCVVSISVAMQFGAGCRRQERFPESHVVVALSAPPRTLDPRFAIDATGSRVVQLMYQSLVRLGPDQRVIPDAAESWSQHGRRYTFFLQEGLRFSNGRELIERDLEETFRFYRGEKSPFRSVMGRIQSVRIHRPQRRIRLELELSATTATFLEELGSLRILPFEAFLPETEKPVDLGMESLGTGFFRWASGDVREIVLEKVERAPLRTARVSGVVFKTIQDDASRLMRVLKGDVDLIQTELPISKAEFLKRQPHLKVMTYLGPSTNYLLFNFRNPLLQSLKVRQAMAHALDIDALIRFQLGGLAEPATTILTPGNPYHAPTLQRMGFDPERARDLLAEGIADVRRSQPEIRPSMLLKTSADPETIEKARILATQLEQVGFRVRVLSNEWGTFFSDVVAGRFEMALMRWVGVVDPDIYRQCFHSEQTPDQQGRNRGFFSNAELDVLLDQSLGHTSEKARVQWARNVQHRIAEQLPILPLWHEHQMVVIGEKLQGFRPSIMGDYLPLVDSEKKSPTLR